ncbi:CCA tRNA nucleotidyltransferase [Sporolactobacillus shoreae]|uniref:CCA-adding enzyme n=1 Tax=Sporolactobacillus shoreae TaxID=1465501 RepID=A0A4Z0GJM5_9BACL|nr:CCA tRNA nucleotidyltransferase [Sporolactobacillus shoreae]TGA97032.1 CCA tRNA nucleotidyltransferase [Sporolactobacillus shoreae]
MRFPFDKATPILDRLNENGFEAYVVGGAVRDYLLGRPIHDIDITTSAHPDEVVTLFQRTIPVGLQHGTVAVLLNGRSFEVTTFRSENGYDDFRHPNQVTFETSLDKDLMRRDFTINALAMDRTGKVIDLFGGQDDMKLKHLRTVGIAEERITEDPLRMMRGIRFVSELGFSLGEDEREAFSKKSVLLKKISVERIDQEMNKLLAGATVSDALRLLFNTGCSRALPLLDKTVAREELFSVRFDLLKSEGERWAAFLRTLGMTDISTFSSAWKWPVSRKKSVGLLLKYEGNYKLLNWDKFSVYSSGPELAHSVERLEAALGKTSVEGLERKERLIDRLWQDCPIRSRSELPVSGHNLIRWSGKEPGPWLSAAIEQLEKEVVTGKVPNEQEGIKRWFMAWQEKQKNQF